MTRSPVPFLTSSWPWRSLAYLLSGGVLGMGVLIPVVGLVLTQTVAGLAAVAVIGLVLAMAAGPLVMRFERWRLRLLDPAPLPAGPSHGPWRTRLRDSSMWRELGYTFASMLALWWIDLGMLILAVGIPSSLMTAPFQPGSPVFLDVMAPLAGLGTLPLAAYPITAWAGGRAAMTRALLVPREAELGEVVRSRARLVDAFEVERRRIERDLHDGAQQQLVALTVTLGLARLDLPPGSPAADRVEKAHAQAKRALAELRELIRGVHPHVLTDRGLAAATRDLAARSPVPVEVDMEFPSRLPSAVEVAAYYVVSEALANVAKHSGATRAWVRGRLSAQGTRLLLEIRDDGKGAADPARGTGLTGLADRAAVLDGTLALSSPPGGPTRLTLEIPLRQET
ncbi:sensor histidine kinase [Bailinhaonella thermotolerans]|uniref:histidine kinase n=2 Tax=Bailinhaonella thermotolerans TaxID=1070861 RepID=A0A3A4B2F1_9ACTN|nr:sensor histidine kinase [Bailinhaonella thermotolerans]